MDEPRVPINYDEKYSRSFLARMTMGEIWRLHTEDWRHRTVALTGLDLTPLPILYGKQLHKIVSRGNDHAGPMIYEFVFKDGSLMLGYNETRLANAVCMPAGSCRVREFS